MIEQSEAKQSKSFTTLEVREGESRGNTPACCKYAGGRVGRVCRRVRGERNVRPKTPRFHVRKTLYRSMYQVRRKFETNAKKQKLTLAPHIISSHIMSYTSASSISRAHTSAVPSTMRRTSLWGVPPLLRSSPLRTTRRSAMSISRMKFTGLSCTGEKMSS